MTQPPRPLPIRDALLQRVSPIIIADLGARDSLDPQSPWLELKSNMKLIGMDPSSEECARQEKLALDLGIEARFHSYLAHSTGGTADFYENNAPGGGSTYEQNRPLTDRWKFQNTDGGVTLASEYFYPTVESSYPACKLANLTRHLDFLKMNIQGGELSAIEGASWLVDDCCGVLTEVSFVESYKGRPLFSDIDRALRNRGLEFFHLWTLHEVGRATSEFTSMRSTLHREGHIPGGQLIEGHALYLRDLIARPRIGITALDYAWKTAILAELFGQIEFALELLQAWSPGWEVLKEIEARYSAP